MEKSFLSDRLNQKEIQNLKDTGLFNAFTAYCRCKEVEPTRSNMIRFKRNYVGYFSDYSVLLGHIFDSTTEYSGTIDPENRIRKINSFCEDHDVFCIPNLGIYVFIK